jgi:hypothetical protein
MEIFATNAIHLATHAKMDSLQINVLPVMVQKCCNSTFAKHNVMLALIAILIPIDAIHVLNFAIIVQDQTQSNAQCVILLTIFTLINVLIIVLNTFLITTLIRYVKHVTLLALNVVAHKIISAQSVSRQWFFNKVKN